MCVKRRQAASKQVKCSEGGVVEAGEGGTRGGVKHYVMAHDYTIDIIYISAISVICMPFEYLQSLCFTVTFFFFSFSPLAL